MKLFSIFSKEPEKQQEREHSLPPLPAPIVPPSTPSPAVVMEQQREKTLTAVQKPRPIPEVDMQSAEMIIYATWVIEQAETIISVHVPPKAGFPVNIHLKKGGVFYLDPLGIYFFSTEVFRHRKRTPMGAGFWVDASHCRSKTEIASYLQNQVALVDGAPFLFPENETEDRVQKRGW